MDTDAPTVEQLEWFLERLEPVIEYVRADAETSTLYESWDDGQFPDIWSDIGGDAFIECFQKVAEHLGGPLKKHIPQGDELAPAADNYPEAILNEVFHVFYRARKSVIRAHMHMTGSIMLASKHHLSGKIDVEGKESTVLKLVELAFWEHAETAYIRLASYWDRVGQVLDFAFFNIRKFDQGGFTAVMDRIHTNVAPMYEELKQSDSWKRMRKFQTLNQKNETGLPWLLQRRNLLVHSLHLHPVNEDDKEVVFNAQHNHLDYAHREKLRPRNPPGEAELLLGQLRQAAELFEDFLTVVGFAPSRKQAPSVGG